jgi:hypothetical protein
MQIETSFVAIAFTSVIGLQGWILKEVVSLKVNVATITTEHNDMKKQINTILALAILAPLLCLFSGCQSAGSVGDALGKVGALPGHLLNRGAQALTDVTTNVVTSVSSNGETITKTNLTAVASPTVAGPIEVAQSISGWLPPQISGPLSIVLTGVSGLLTLAVRRRQRALDQSNQDLAEAGNDVASLYDQLRVVVTGVEKAVTGNKPVKETIAKEAAKAGIADKLNNTVQATVS